MFLWLGFFTMTRSSVTMFAPTSYAAICIGLVYRHIGQRPELVGYYAFILALILLSFAFVECRMVKKFVTQTSGIEVASTASEQELMRMVMTR